MIEILLTGGSGFIGSHFHRLLPSGKFINLDLKAPDFKSSESFVKGDIRKYEDVIRILRGHRIKTIISLAAKHHDFGIGHDEYFDTNEEGTRVICRAATEAGVNRIVFYSSVAVYGIRDQPSDEGMAPIPDSPYGASKLAGEKVLADWASESPERQVLIIRPTLVFGENNRANMYNLIRQIDSGWYFILGDGSNIKSIAYVENLVRATQYLAERMKTGVAIYNYADEPQLSVREISTTIAGELGKKIRWTIPMQIGILLGYPFDALIKITGKNIPISTARIKKLGTQTYHVAEKIRSEGFVAQISTQEGLRRMVAWYRRQKMG